MEGRRSSRSSAARRRAAMRSGSGMYVDGNTVRKPQEAYRRRPAPDYDYDYDYYRRERRRAYTRGANIQTSEGVSYQMSKDVQKNREKAAGINSGFVLFLTAISIAVLIFSIQYLQLKSELTTRIKQVGVLESQLKDLRQENDAYYSQVVNDVDLEQIKKIARERLNMGYPKDDQVEYYQTARSTYVRQYQDVPDSK